MDRAVNRRTHPDGVPWARPTDDPWLGSRRVVQVRPHVWRWLAPMVTGAPVLEIGPGLRPSVPPETSHFVDRSQHALSLLAARGGQVALATDRLPLPDAHFAAVVAFEVLEHIEGDDHLLREIVRVLRTGGRLVMSVPIRESMWTTLDDACGHVRRYEPEALFTKLAGLGLQVGGYHWHHAARPVSYRIRARILMTRRRATTAIAQALAFPLLSAYQARSAAISWTSPTVPVPAEAEHLTLWAELLPGTPAEE